MANAITGDEFRGRFEIIRELGKGGMGEVFLAHDVFTQCDVAVKMAKNKMFDDVESGVRMKKSLAERDKTSRQASPPPYRRSLRGRGRRGFQLPRD